VVQNRLQQKVLETLSQKTLHKKKKKRAGRVAQVVEHLPIMYCPLPPRVCLSVCV
jgi:hypothetical protein